MSIEKFIPLSPDPNITTDSDMKLAQFGHLNTIVDYLNAYVVVDSLQLAGSGPITATARYISDSTGVNSAISISTIGVGIGTDAPIAPLNIYNSSSSVSSVILVEQDTSAIIGQINQYRKNGSVNLASGAEIGRLSFGGYFNSTYSPFSQVCSAITAYYGGTGTDRVGGLRLTTWNGGGQTTRLQVAPDGKIGIGTTSATAKLQILGDGSTSATTSLLVQNSSGNNALKIQDDFVAVFGSTALKILTIRPESTTGVFGNSCAIGGGAGTGRLDFYSNSNITSLYDNIVILDGTAQNLQVGPAGITATVSTGAFKINSTTQGFLKPKMTTAQKNAIVTPAAGLEVYDTDLNRPCFYSGSAWVTL